jgi:hypothetical protein
MPPKKKSSTGKKEKTSVLSEKPADDTQPLPTTTNDHVLLKLPLSEDQLNVVLKDSNFMNDVYKYTPDIKDPEPYDPLPLMHSLDLHSAHTADLQQHGDRVSAASQSSDALLQTPYHTSGKKQKICFWCCHEVGHETYGMPIRYDYVNKTFTMYGTFCSLECAAAHNFSVHLGSDRAWEIHSWIQMLGKRYGYKEPIRPAPSRYLLDMFDGPLTIDEFRNAHKGQTRTYVLNIPPLISISSHMDIVNTSFLGNTSEEKVKEKHGRKYVEKKRTIDTKLGLKIQAGGFAEST